MTKLRKALNKTIGKNLKILRESRGMTQLELAEMLEIAHQQIHKYEKGESAITSTRLHALSQALRVPYEYFFEALDSPGCLHIPVINPAIMTRALKIQQIADQEQRGKILKIIDILAA